MSQFSRDPRTLYRDNLNLNTLNIYKHRLKKDVYALIDYNEDGNIDLATHLKFAIITRKEGSLYCHCERADCFHLAEAIRIWSDDNDMDFDTGDSPAWVVNEALGLFATYCKKDKSYGFVRRVNVNNKTIECFTCTDNIRSCSHVRLYRAKFPREYISPGISSISANPIPYMLEEEERQNLYTTPPEHLFPKYSPTNKCVCNFAYDPGCPKENKWILSSKAKIHDARRSIDCIVYFRPTIGSCECIQPYDGNHDMVLNCDNANLFTWGWMYDIMHLTQETRLPIAALYRAVNRSRENAFGPEQKLKSHVESILRKAYNSFLRLLNLDFLNLFKCNVCKDDVRVVLMDGIQMGCQQDLMPPKPQRRRPANRIQEGDRAQRVYVTKPEARKFLATYAGYSKGKYKEPTEMERSDILFNASVQVTFEDRPALKMVLLKAKRKCPPWLQKLAGELSRGNPTCGVIQITGDSEEAKTVNRILRQVEKQDYSELNSNLDLITKLCPILYDFIQFRKPYVSALLGDLLDNIWAPFAPGLPGDHYYEAPQHYNNLIEVFPNHNQLRGSASYDADRSKEKAEEECNKEPKETKLSPGLFTMYCPHGICLGLQLMDSPESPKTPFDLLVRRFQNIPRLIIYDNSCNLQVYSLKREPKRFANTRFMVDRWHGKNHVCSEGYSMKAYTKDTDIPRNSQICEQSNSALRRLGTQVAYMEPENAIYLVKIFLAIRNRDILKNNNL